MTTLPPGYTGNEIDTEGVVGEPGAAPSGTQNRAGDVDTTGTGNGAYGGGPTGQAQDPNTATNRTPDTSGAGQGQSATYTPVINPSLTGTIDTTVFGWPQTPGVTQAYRAPNTTVGFITGERDTTRTDQPTSDGLGATRVDVETYYTGTLFSSQIGAPTGPVGTGVPVAPSAAPTVAAGPRSVTVSWAGVADPSNAEVRGYMVLGSTGGTTYAGRADRSVVVTNLVPDTNYTFRVAARNDNGWGPLSAASSVVQAYNPDEPDHALPGGLNPYWAQNPIYGPNGTVKTGSGLSGRPGAPTGVTLSGTTVPGVVNVSWTAPTGAGTVSSYTVTLSSGQTKSIPAGTTTAQFTGVSSATAITATVTSVGSVANATSSPSAAFGKPTAPAAPTVTSPSAGTLHVTWTAPSSGAPLNYILTLGGGDTTTHTVAGNVLTYDFTGLTTGHSDTCTVGAQGSVSTTTSAASSAVTVA